MGAGLVVVIITGVFFVIGLMVGGVMVLALPLLRDRRSRRSKPREPGEGPVEPGYDHVPRDATGSDDAAPDERPGDGDSGHSGR